MARQRDYAREYARRQQRAREQGWQSYWQRRQTQAAADEMELRGRSRMRLIDAVKDSDETGLTAARVRHLWVEGHEAMRNGDIERARQIADELDLEPDQPTYPPESAFWYH